MPIVLMDSSQFDWLSWRAGSICDVFNIKHREPFIIAAKDTLLKYAIGWCPSEQTTCRPKAGFIAVMFLKDDRMFWTHITKNEFNAVFGGTNG